MNVGGAELGWLSDISLYLELLDLQISFIPAPLQLVLLTPQPASSHSALSGRMAALPTRWLLWMCVFTFAGKTAASGESMQLFVYTQRAYNGAVEHDLVIFSAYLLSRLIEK